jgi:tRNA threonylcarbamoyladenosine biosynthesis protein TsaB
MAPLAMILHTNSFEPLLSAHKVLFCGSGSGKLKQLLSNTNASFTDLRGTAGSIAALANDSFNQKILADIAYVEPLYLKDFHSSTQKG